MAPAAAASPTAAATLARLAQGSVAWGAAITDTMLVSRWTRASGWGPTDLLPVADGLSISPATSCLHYGCSVFEGMKAFSAAGAQDPAGDAAAPGAPAALFRPEYHAARLNASARRMALPEVDAEVLVRDIKRLVRKEMDAGWMPTAKGASLYVRPLLMASEPAIGVHRSSEAMLVVTCHPVASYFGPGDEEGGEKVPKSLRLLVDPKGRVRAWPGGFGFAKAAGNYAGSIGPAEEAAEQGFDQVLWLGGDKDRCVGECGQMNFFWVEKDETGGKKLVTPELDGTILPGATRDSILKLAVELGVADAVDERRVPLDEFTAKIGKGSVIEMFGSGTGAIVVPVKSVYVDGLGELIVKECEEPRDASVVLRKALLDIYHQRKASAWMKDIDEISAVDGADAQECSFLDRKNAVKRQQRM